MTENNEHFSNLSPNTQQDSEPVYFTEHHSVRQAA
jgi:hypothetical protein